MITKDQAKKIGGSLLLALAASPPVFAAIGAVWAPAAVIGLSIQEFLHIFNIIQPGAVQGAATVVGGYLLKESKPKNISVPEAKELLQDAQLKEVLQK